MNTASAVASPGGIVKRQRTPHRRRGHRAGLLSIALGCLSGVFSSLPVCGQQSEPVFANRLEGSGIDYVNISGSPEKKFILSSLGSGAAVFDYDQDGDLDLYLVNGAGLGVDRTVQRVATNRLYRNRGNFVFSDVTEPAGVGDTAWGFGCTVGDVDNDGFPDLYVTNFGPNRLYRNRGDGTFEEIAAAAGIDDPSWGASASFFDADHDGNLDLYVTNYVDARLETLPTPGDDPTCRWLGLEVMCGPRGLEPAADKYFMGTGRETFSSAGNFAGLDTTSAAFGLGVVHGDYDLDGDVDLYVANDTMPNFLLQNDGNGVFEEAGFLSGVAYNGQGEAEAGMGVDFGDWNGDGLVDLFVTNFSHETNTAYRNFGEGLFAEVTDATNLATPSLGVLGWASRFEDFDLDGRLDLFIANGHVYPRVAETDPEAVYAPPNHLFWNRGDIFELGHFADSDPINEKRSSRGAAFGDLDDDGRTDLVIVNIDASPSLLQNLAAEDRHWLRLRLIGTSVNRDSLGARVVLHRGRLSDSDSMRELHVSGSFLSASDPRVLFGLGDESAADVDSIEIHWPGGGVQHLASLPIDRTILIKEGKGVVGLVPVVTR